MSDETKKTTLEEKDKEFIHVRLSKENTAEMKSISEEIGHPNVISILVNEIIKRTGRNRKIEIARKLTEVDELLNAMKDPEKKKAIEAIMRAKK